MARTKPPSFDFFPDDFIAGTYHLPADAVGIYVRLLCYQWNNGSIPSDENELARVAGVDADAMRTHMRTVMLKFMPDGCGGFKNARLERERDRKLSVIEKSKSAADSRWTKEKARKAAEAARLSGCGGNADGYAPYFQRPTSYFHRYSHTRTPSGRSKWIDRTRRNCTGPPPGVVHSVARLAMAGLRQETTRNASRGLGA
jgi:uncharacterized protein YdaU (DUF1376 family)